MSVFSCKDTVGLASEAFDHALPLGRRLALRFHLLMCRKCARFHRHLRALNAAARRLADQAVRGDVGPAGLSPEARDRMRRALEQRNA